MDDDEAPDGDEADDGGQSDGGRSDGGAATDRPADDEEWRFSLEDVEERETEARTQAEAAERAREPLVAGRPSVENALFVLLGALLALFVVSRLFVA